MKNTESARFRRKATELVSSHIPPSEAVGITLQLADESNGHLNFPASAVVKCVVFPEYYRQL
jgi:hypothetical protein